MRLPGISPAPSFAPGSLHILVHVFNIVPKVALRKNVYSQESPASVLEWLKRQET